MPVVTIILNTASGRGKAQRHQEEVSRACRDVGIDHEVLFTEGPGHAEQLANDAASAGSAIVMAAGGDGTVNEVANGLLTQDNRSTLLGILPLGSGNDIAHNIGAPGNLSEVMALAASRETCRCDVGQVEVSTPAGTLRRYFLNNAGLGFEAQVNICSKSIRRLRKLPLYLLATLQAMAKHHPIPMTLLWETDSDSSQTWQGDVTMVSVANGARTGGGFRILPQARLNDQWLDLGIVPAVSTLRMLHLLTQVMRGTHLNAPELSFARFRTMSVQAEAPFALHVDGEVLTQDAERVTVSLATQTLSILAPHGDAQP